jgi:hypothetical protein
MDPLCWPRNTLYPQKLAPTSPTSRVRSRTKATELLVIKVRLSPLGTPTTIWPTVPAPDDGWWECVAVSGVIGRGNRCTRRKPAPVPCYPSRITHDLTWARTRTAAVECQQLTAWAMEGDRVRCVLSQTSAAVGATIDSFFPKYTTLDPMQLTLSQNLHRVQYETIYFHSIMIGLHLFRSSSHLSRSLGVSIRGDWTILYGDKGRWRESLRPDVNYVSVLSFFRNRWK